MKFLSRLLAKQGIKVSDGKVLLSKGKLKSAGKLVRDVSSLCQELGIRDCELWLDGAGRVTFSKEIPEKHHQKFRNVVTMHI